MMPYLYTQAADAAEHGTPMMRAMMLEFPDDPACDYLDRQYMLGDSLLVAPVFSERGDVSFYLPEGRWTHLFSNTRLDGGRWHKEQHDFTSLPLYVRPNTLLALGSQDQRPDYDYCERPLFQLFELEDGHHAESRLVDQAGVTQFTLRAERHGQQITLQTTGNAPGWRLCLRNVMTLTDVRHAGYQQDERGTMITPETAAESITITLP
jgi:alpha-D-xyloside xylohydrolase